MNENHFILPAILVCLFLFQFLSISATRYGASCSSDSDCDQHQRCENFICRCNSAERRFWTGEICAICVTGFTCTIDRCYQAISEFKTWSEARSYCRSRYADLFTWRNNNDEQFIRPVVQAWSSAVIMQLIKVVQGVPASGQQYRAWAGATITSVNPYVVKWVDPNGMQLTSSSEEWCDPTVHAGYTSPKEPTSQTRQTENSTEREDCVAYIVGYPGVNLLCLADDYCSQKYPFICEMNAASMQLANTVNHGSDDDIDFEKDAPTPIPSSFNPDQFQLGAPNPSATDSPLALADKSSGSSMTVYLLLFVGILLIVGAIVGYILIRKKKQTTNDTISRDGGASEGQASFTSSVKSMVE